MAAETHWAYSGQLDPEHWSHSYPTCAGASQSPIDLNPDKATPMHPLPIHLGHYDTSEKMLHLINNGHSGIEYYLVVPCFTCPGCAISRPRTKFLPCFHSDHSCLA